MFIHLWNNVYNGESRAISHLDDTEQQTQQVAGNPRF